MNPVMTRQRARLYIRLFAATIAAAAQVSLVGAPLAEGRSGPDAVAHVETAGTRLHYAHDEATCAACVSQHLLSSSEPAHTEDFVLATSSPLPGDAVRGAISLAQLLFTRSRAPPTAAV